MAKQSRSNDPQKVKEWLSAHEHDGTVNGEPIILDRPVELRGHVHERDYNDALRLAAPWGEKKSFIAEHGILCVASRSPVFTPSEMESIPVYEERQEVSRLFRGKVSQGTLNILRKELSQYNLNASQQATVVLRYFINCPTVNRVYQVWLRELMQQINLSHEEIETIIYDFYRVDGVKKRLSALEANDPEANLDRMP